MAATPEGKVKLGIKKLLKARGIYYYMPVQGGLGVVGIPDFICCVPCVSGGRFLAIEAKAPGKRGNTTANQDAQIAAIQRSSGVAVIIDDPAQLEFLLDEYAAKYTS